MSLRTTIARSTAPLSCHLRIAIMPLRAKVTNPAWKAGTQMVSEHKPSIRPFFLRQTAA